jgi:hypothetical protein
MQQQPSGKSDREDEKSAVDRTEGEARKLKRTIGNGSMSTCRVAQYGSMFNDPRNAMSA